MDLTYPIELRDLNELNFARFDARLEQRLAEFRAEFRAELGDLRSELRAGLAEMRTELRTALADLRAELLRWMFGFWATTLMALVGLVLALRR